MSRNRVSRVLKPCDISLTERNFRAQGIVYVESLQGKVSTVFLRAYLLLQCQLFPTADIVSHPPPLPVTQLSMCRCATLISVSPNYEPRQRSPVGCLLGWKAKEAETQSRKSKTGHRKGCVCSWGPINIWRGSSSRTCEKYIECFLEVSIWQMAKIFTHCLLSLTAVPGEAKCLLIPGRVCLLYASSTGKTCHWNLEKLAPAWGRALRMSLC